MTWQIRILLRPLNGGWGENDEVVVSSSIIEAEDYQQILEKLVDAGLLTVADRQATLPAHYESESP